MCFRHGCLAGYFVEEKVDAMNETNTNEPAFPRDHAHQGHNGMTLRDYFAIRILQSLLNNANAVLSHKFNSIEISETAYTIADKMISERNKVRT
jgi:hypothetical protein